MTFEEFFDWTQNLDARQQALEKFARATGAEIQEGCFAWGDGLYLILHFDLMTVGPDVDRDTRSEVYDRVGQAVRKARGTRLTESVYLVPLMPRCSSEKCAAIFWNDLAGQLGDLLVGGDAFYLHYAPDVRNLMGGIAEVVPEGQTSLSRAREPNA